MDSKLQHRVLLTKLGQRLSSSDVEDLVFISEAVLHESTAEGIKTATGLFRELEHRAFLAPGDYTFLKGSLMNIGRNDLADMLPSIKEDHLSQAFSSLNCSDTSTQAKKYCPAVEEKRVLLHISNQLRKEDLEKAAYLCSSEIHGGIHFIQYLERNGIVRDGNYGHLAEILIEIGRDDLSQLLKSTDPMSLPSSMGEYSQKLTIMVEALRESQRSYTSNFQMLKDIAEGNDRACGMIFNDHQTELTGQLSHIKRNFTRGQTPFPPDSGSIKDTLTDAFNSLHTLLKNLVTDIKSQTCRKCFKLRSHTYRICTKDETYRFCRMGMSAYCTNEFLEQVSTELIGTKDSSGNKVRYAISICSKVVFHLPTLMRTLGELLYHNHRGNIDIKVYKKELTDAFLQHKNYIEAVLPIVAKFLPHSSLQVLSANLGLIFPATEGSDFDSVSDYGYVRMITIPTYTLLLYLLSLSYGPSSSNTMIVMIRLEDYLGHRNHYIDAKEFIKSCGKALQTEIVSYRKKLLDRCEQPMIRDLINS